MIKSRIYGECILKGYQEVEQGMCANEFGRFKACVEVGSVPAVGTMSSEGARRADAAGLAFSHGGCRRR